MIGCIAFLMMADMTININAISWIPSEITQFVGIEKIGLCEFFCILFTIYEAISIAKNGILCGLPFPKFIKNKLEKLLNSLTGELENEEE